MQSPYQRAPESKNPLRIKHKYRMSTLLLMCIFIALLGLMYLLFPGGKQMRAIKTIGGEVQSNAAVADPMYAPLIITEVMAANATAVPDDKGSYSDYIEIFNSSDEPINLSGVGVSDRSDRIKFIFPNYELGPKQFVIVYANNKNFIDADTGIFHAKFKLTSLGETVYLFDPHAFVIDSVSLPIMAQDEAYSLFGDGQYRTTDQYSPGYDNTEEGYLAYRSGSASSQGIIVINEVCPDPKSGLRDEEQELQDWIELYNTSDEVVSLANFTISDKENKPFRWKFASDAIIEPHGYYVLYCSGKDRVRKDFPHTNFKLSAEKETIVLSDAKGRLIDRVTIDNIPEDNSYGLNENGEWQIFQIATPGAPNNAEGRIKSDRLLRSQNPTGVFISEVMASNDSVQLGPNLISADYVELYNSSNKPVNLSGFGLSDNLGRPRRWQFPGNTNIAPQSYLLVILDGDTKKSTENELHANFKIAKDGHETITFSDSQGRILDRIPLPSIPSNVAYGRMLGQEGFYYFKTPTPLKANTDLFYGYADKPTFSVKGGQYKGSIDVALQAAKGAAIYYTTDGSIPTEQSTLYTEPLHISQTTALRARAFASGLEPSTVETQSYMMNLYHSMPVVSITVDPDELWNEARGIFTVGPNVDKSGGIPFKNTVYREYGKIERPGHIEIFELDGSTLVDQNMEFALQGQYSLDMPQKTLKVRSKSKYGAKYFDAKLFENRDFTQYKSFVLRNSGNDNVWTRLVDGLQHQLAEKLNTTVIKQAWKPVIVYINGQYYGHYNLRERADRFFIAQHEGLTLAEADQMDVVEANRKTYFGSNKEFSELKEVAANLNPKTNPADLQYLTDRIDVENYFDYTAIEMFFGNSDPGNIRCYKLHKEGSKWRWLLFDLDYGLFNSKFDSPASYLKPEGAGQQKIPNILIRKLLENDEMRDLFLQRLGIVFKTFTSDVMLEELNRMVAILEPEMGFHFARWAELNDKAINFDSPTTAQGAMSYWKQRINRLTSVIRKRPALFYDMVQNQFGLSNAEMLNYFGEKPFLPEE